MEMVSQREGKNWSLLLLSQQASTDFRILARCERPDAKVSFPSLVKRRDEMSYLDVCCATLHRLDTNQHVNNHNDKMNKIKVRAAR